MAEVTQVILCPYCGHTQTKLNKCDACGGLFDQLSLRATQVSMGPWFIRDKKRPYRPGCSYEILKKQIGAGKIKGTTILRGPTTRQFWSVARNIPGVAHLLGSCHQCGVHVNPSDTKCQACNALFRDVHLRNELGLFYPTEAAAQAAQKNIEREVAGLPPLPGKAASGAPGAAPAAPGTMTAAVLPGAPGVNPAKPPGAGEDLLDEVLGRVAKQTQGVNVGKPEVVAPAKPAAAPAKPAPAPAPASGLSFDPADEDEEEEEEVVSRRGPGITTYLLIIAIIVILAAQAIFAALWFLNRNKTNQSASSSSNVSTPADATPSDAQPDSSTPSKPTPAASADSSKTPAGSDSDDMVDRAYHSGPAMAHEPTAEERGNPLSPYYKPPVDPHKKKGDTDTTASKTPDSSTPATSQTPDAKPTDPKPTDSKPQESPQPKSIEARLARAKYLEDQNKPEEALKILKDIQRNTPLTKQPVELDEAIRRVEATIATKKSGGYFKVDP